MKTLSTPLSVHENSVLDSEYFEQDSKTPHKKKPHATRSGHKHTYVPAWLESYYVFPLTDDTFIKMNPITYCPVCGRIGKYGIANATRDSSDLRSIIAFWPQHGDKVFRTPRDGTPLKNNRVNLDDFYIQE